MYPCDTLGVTMIMTHRMGAAGLFSKLFMGERHFEALVVAWRALIVGVVCGVLTVIVTGWHASPVMSILAAGVAYVVQL